MALFVILLPSENPKFAAEIKSKFPTHYEITSTQLVISARQSSPKEAWDYLVPNNNQNAVILEVTRYWGRANQDLWAWMKARIEESSNG